MLVHGVVDPADRARVSAPNLLLRAAAEGHLPLGATVADVIARVRADRWAGWTPAHRSNMLNVLGYVQHLLVYREPDQDDPPEVAAWKHARLEVPGVEEGGSLHVALMLVPDLADATTLRRHTDRRVERLNDQALLRHEAAWMRYQQARAEHTAGTRRGRLPARPPETVELRTQPAMVSARTEELFAGALGMVLATAERRGLLIGPNPWRAFAPTGRPHVGYRRAPAQRTRANRAVVRCCTANVQASGGGHDVEIPEGGTAILTLPIGATVHVSGSGACGACGACGASIRLAAQVPGASPKRFDQTQSLTYTVSTPTTKIAVLWTPCVPPASGPAPACPLTQYGMLVLHSPG